MRRRQQAPDVATSRSEARRFSLSQAWALVAVSLPVLVITGTPLVAIDLAYHLRAGDLLLSDGFLRTDGFTATAAGLPWANQQWLTQILLALAFRAGGWLGLTLLRAVLGGLALTLVFLACRARGADRKTAAWLTLAAGVVLPPGLQLRPQLFGIVCFAAALWLIARRDGHPRSLLFLPPLAAVWANLHGSFPLILVLIALAWLEEHSLRGGEARDVAVLGAASAAATLLNPLGIGVWSYAVGLSTDPIIRRVVEEWQPPTIESYAGVVFFLSVAGVAMLLARVGRSVSLPAYLTLGLFFALGLTATRGVYWWAMAGAVVLAPALAIRDRRPAPDPVNPLNAVVIGLAAVGFVVVLLPWLWHADREDPGERFLGYAPPGITEALEGRLEPGQVIYNAQEWGSWLEFRFPENAVTTDSRFEVIPDPVWRLNGLASDGVQGWQRILDAWGADVAVLSRSQQEELIPRMRSDPSWRVVYEDDDGVVLVRR